MGIMYCKKCGSEIKEGNTFCTNCGTAVNKTQKNNKLKEDKVLIIIIIVWIIIMCVIVGIKWTNSKKVDASNNYNNEHVSNIVNDILEQENETLVKDDIEKNKSLLEQIELIDSNKEYPVCYNEYGEYWILDREGKKIYFNDLEGFKNAVKLYKERANNIPEKIESIDTNNNLNSNSTVTSNNQNTNNNNSEDKQTTDNKEDECIILTRKQLENKTEQELKNLLTSNGLIPKVVSKTEKIAYCDDLANTIKSTVEIQLGNEGNNFYYKGNTVEITNTYYKPISWTASLYFSVEGSSFNINGKKCFIDNQNVGRYSGAYCFFENPLELDSYWLYGDARGKGVKFYINDKLMETGRKGYYEFTFDNVETVTYKIVAPYIYEFDEGILSGEEGTMVGTNVVVYEKKLNVKELYKNMRGDIVELKIK